ncbi:MAG TPA: hypothetical protein ENK70_07530 [Methylophaga sp.]|nr:hypothetical protein [Methylophaga sp.]
MMQNNAFATGGGSEACTLIVKDVSDSTVIEGARIVVRTLDQTTAKVNNMTTDVNGVRILELDVASYFASITANNYIRITDTIAVAQDSTWTLYMSEFDPGSPSDTGQCIVYVYAGNLIDTLVGADFRAIPLGKGNWKHSDGRLIIPETVSSQTNSSGYAELTIWQTHEVTNQKGDSLYYRFQIITTAGVRKFDLRKHAVPDSANYWLRSLK